MGFLLSGFLHVPVLLVLSLTTLGIAVSYALRPGERKLGILRPMSAATVFAALSAMCAGFGASLRNAAEPPAAAADQAGKTLLLTAGAAEAMVPGVFCFAVLALTWALIAVGLRRQD